MGAGTALKRRRITRRPASSGERATVLLQQGGSRYARLLLLWRPFLTGRRLPSGSSMQRLHLCGSDRASP